MRFFISTILLSLFILTGTTVSAQIPTGDLVQIEQRPEYPRSRQSVTITLKSSSTDLQNSTITWTVNGTQQSKGKGVISSTLVTGKPGSITKVGITILTPEGATVKKTVDVRPADVDLVWETDGYTPPFYKGRSNFTYQSNLKISAIPDFYTSGGVKVDPKTLVYTWKRDSTVLGSLSGYGKDSLTIKGGAVAKPSYISVNVSDANGLLHGVMGLEIESTAPQIFFYEDSPLYGVLYNKAIGDVFAMRNTETTFVAVPFGFSNPSVTNNALQYLWTINNRERSDLGTAKSITLRTKEDVEGISTVGLNIKNNIDIFQSANRTFNVQFIKKTESEPIEF